jgi:hypothetical protein
MSQEAILHTGNLLKHLDPQKNNQEEVNPKNSFKTSLNMQFKNV